MQRIDEVAKESDIRLRLHRLDSDFDLRCIGYRLAYLYLILSRANMRFV